MRVERARVLVKERRQAGEARGVEGEVAVLAVLPPRPLGEDEVHTLGAQVDRPLVGVVEAAAVPVEALQAQGERKDEDEKEQREPASGERALGEARRRYGRGRRGVHKPRDCISAPSGGPEGMPEPRPFGLPSRSCGGVSRAYIPLPAIMAVRSEVRQE